METLLQRIEQSFLAAQMAAIEDFNLESLKPPPKEALRAPRDGFLEAREHLDGLRIPVYRRSDSPETYAAPGIERRPAPQINPGGSTEPLEPVLVDDLYRHIIEVIEAMARGMERNPGDYAQWTEEQLRDALLVILNTHYTGQAMGEAFNKSGKTDILIRVEGRNVFIGECKWWSGAKAFAGSDADRSALDQLLSYATWRDAKLALAVFVGNQDITAVITSARATLEGHPSFVTWSDSGDEARLRARVRLAAGAGRAADLAVMFAHLPRS